MHSASNVEVRDLDFPKDMDAIKRIWREIGWADNDQVEKGMDICYPVGHKFADRTTVVSPPYDV